MESKLHQRGIRQAQVFYRAANRFNHSAIQQPRRSGSVHRKLCCPIAITDLDQFIPFPTLKFERRHGLLLLFGVLFAACHDGGLAEAPQCGL